MRTHLFCTGQECQIYVDICRNNRNNHPLKGRKRSLVQNSSARTKLTVAAYAHNGTGLTSMLTSSLKWRNSISRDVSTSCTDQRIDPNTGSLIVGSDAVSQEEIDVEGLKWSYRFAKGKDDMPTIVLLHGESFAFTLTKNS